MKEADRLGKQTIRDFGEQWNIYSDNQGFYGSTQFFLDTVSPFLNRENIFGQKVVDLGAGTGRVVIALLVLGAAHIIALEPSDAFKVLTHNIGLRRRVTFLNLPGDRLPAYGDIDLVLSLRVLHHIPDPAPVVKAALRSLRLGGQLCIWLYAHEGNEAYLMLAQPFRKITVHLPHRLLEVVTVILHNFFKPYVWTCKILSLPWARYLCEIYDKLTPDKQRLVIYDQLKPTFTKYYYKDEARALLENAGFKNVRVYHQRNYCWLVIGTKA